QFSLNAFGKYITMSNSVGKTTEKLGYGMALSYYIIPDLQLRTSYEMTNRVPEANEVYGDLENQVGNSSLKAENSDNVNLGVVYGFKLNDINRFSITANAIYRYSADFIYTRLVGGTSANQYLITADNREGVRTTGVDGEIRYSYKNWLSAGATVTYQMLKNLQKHDPIPGQPGMFYDAESDVYLDRMPNIPYFFGNADVSASFSNVGKKGNNLTVGYNMLFVNSFWLRWPSLGSATAETKYVVPTQLSHDLNFVYSMNNGRYNVSFEARNIFDKAVFDNYSLQKPGRAFYLNLRYFFKQSQ
ncbi:tonB-linked outer membrane receptor P92, partial [Pedobacter sp. BAL39]|uniref:TonB-dependent receptor domain-containing protein n=1 Tax=Pedobacter sp. BAL39 TaxID=391596 RepID=UPI000155A14E